MSLLTAEWLKTPTHAASFISSPIALFLHRAAELKMPETPQERGVDAVAVALDDLHAKGLTRVHDVSTLINRKRDEAVLRFHELPHKIQKYFRVSYELRNMKQQKERDKTRNQIISKHILKMNTY